jgi:hypothetical protein
MALQEWLDFFQNDPRISKLTWAQQLELRAKYFPQILSEEPVFLSLPPERQNALLQRLVGGMAPAFEAGAGLRENTQQWVDRASTEEVAALNEIRRTATWGTLTRGMGLVNSIERYISAPLFRLTKVATTWVADLFQRGPLPEETKSRIDKFFARASLPDLYKQVDYYNFFLDTAPEKVFDTDFEDVFGYTPRPDDPMTTAFESWKGQFGWGGREKTARTLAGPAGILTEFMSFYGAAGALGSMNQATGVVKYLTQGLTDKISRLGAAGWKKLLGLKAARAAVHASVGGLSEVLHENLNDLAIRGANDIGFLNNMVQSAKFFGYGAGADMAIFGVAGFLKDMAFPIGKSLLGPERAVVKAMQKGVTGGKVTRLQALDILKDTLALRNVDAARLAALSPGGQAVVKSTRASAELVQGVIKNDPEHVFRAVAALDDFVADKVGRTWKMSTVYDPENILFRTTKLSEAQGWLTDSLKELHRPRGALGQVVGAAYNQIQVKEVLKAPFRQLPEQVDVLTNMVSPKNGVFESRGVRSFAKVYAATSGAIGFHRCEEH